MNLFILFTIFILFNTSFAKYNTEHFIETPFKSKHKLFNFIGSTKFFRDYLDIVGNENTKFVPSIENKLMLNSPQEIEYISNPNIKLLPSLFRKTKIKHKWNKIGDEFYGNIDTFYINFDLKMYSEFINGKLVLKFYATVNKKKFFVPNIAVKYGLQDFGNVFSFIIKKYK